MHVQPINVQRTSARTKQKIMDSALSTEGRNYAAVKDVLNMLSEEECVRSTVQQHIDAAMKIVIKS